MTIIEHLLTCLAEECGEVAKPTHKALRFGLDDRDPKRRKAPTNREEIILEANDFMTIMEILVERGVIPEDWECEERKAAKRKKVDEFLRYAYEAGTLTEEPPAAPVVSKETPWCARFLNLVEVLSAGLDTPEYEALAHKLGRVIGVKRLEDETLVDYVRRLEKAMPKGQTEAQQLIEYAKTLDD